MLDAQYNILLDFCKTYDINVLLATKYINERRKKLYDPEHIINVCCKEYGISLNEFMSKKRNQKIIFARFSFYAIASYKTNLNKSQIARITGHDHATILNGINQAYNLYDNYPKFKDKMDNIVRTLTVEHNA